MLALLACMGAPVVLAQSPAPLATPNLQLQNGGFVFASVALPDGSVIVGGNFSSFNSVLHSNVAKFKSDGTLDPTWSPAVTGPAVWSLAVDSNNGDVYIGGLFTSVNGVARANLAKVHGDGSLDALWDPSPQVSDPNGAVFALALDGAGNLFVGGDFTCQSLTNLAKVSTSGTGTADTAWNPTPMGDLFTPNATVYTLAYDGTNLFAGGTWVSIHANGVDVGANYLAKISPTAPGAVDETWNPQPDQDPGMGQGNSVLALALDGSGNLFVGGTFYSMGGDPFPADMGTGVYRNGLAKLSTSGAAAVDGTWDPGSNSFVTTMHLDGSGHLYVGGGFTSIGGQSLSNIARLSTSGTGSADTWNPALSSGVLTITIPQSGLVYAGGAFVIAGGARHFGFAEITSAGAVSAFTPDAERPGQVMAIASLADGSMIVGGHFVKSGQQTRNNILRVQADGTLDLAWNVSAGNTVDALALDGAGNVYAGGEFLGIGGRPIAFVARLSATGTGAVDPNWAPGPDDAVYALLVNGTHVYLGGAFLNVGDQTYNGGLARVSTDIPGDVDNTWVPFATDASFDYGNVYTLAFDGGYLYAGGQFFDGASGAIQNVARYSTAGHGSPDTTWNPAASVAASSANQVRALYPDGAGNLFVGGQFQNMGAQTNTNLAKVSTSGAGTADATWNPSADELVVSVLPDGNGKLYVGGGFFNIGGQSHRCIARVSATGTGAADALWNPSADNYVRALVLGPVNGDVYAAGDFINTGTESRFGLAAFATDVIFSNGLDGLISK